MEEAFGIAGTALEYVFGGLAALCLFFAAAEFVIAFRSGRKRGKR